MWRDRDNARGYTQHRLARWPNRVHASLPPNQTIAKRDTLSAAPNPPPPQPARIGRPCDWKVRLHVGLIVESICGLPTAQLFLVLLVWRAPATGS